MPRGSPELRKTIHGGSHLLPTKGPLIMKRKRQRKSLIEGKKIPTPNEGLLYLLHWGQLQYKWNKAVDEHKKLYGDKAGKIK